MKMFLPLFFLFLLISCKTQKNVATYTNCPEDGICSTEIIPNSSLKLHTDTIGMLYTTIEKGEHLIFKFSYSKNVDKQYVDGHYIEEVYAEFDGDLSEINLENDELQNVNLLFNRVCFCKGSTGFYPITKGKLSIKKINKNNYNIQLNFKVDEVPQVITTVNETVILK